MPDTPNESEGKRGKKSGFADEQNGGAIAASFGHSEEVGGVNQFGGTMFLDLDELSDSTAFEGIMGSEEDSEVDGSVIFQFEDGRLIYMSKFGSHSSDQVSFSPLNSDGVRPGTFIGDPPRSIAESLGERGDSIINDELRENFSRESAELEDVTPLFKEDLDLDLALYDSGLQGEGKTIYLKGDKKGYEKALKKVDFLETAHTETVRFREDSSKLEKENFILEGQEREIEDVIWEGLKKMGVEESYFEDGVADDELGDLVEFVSYQVEKKLINGYIGRYHKNLKELDGKRRLHVQFISEIGVIDEKIIKYGAPYKLNVFWKLLRFVGLYHPEGKRKTVLEAAINDRKKHEKIADALALNIRSLVQLNDGIEKVIFYAIKEEADSLKKIKAPRAKVRRLERRINRYLAKEERKGGGNVKVTDREVKDFYTRFYLAQPKFPKNEQGRLDTEFFSAYKAKKRNALTRLVNKYKAFPQANEPDKELKTLTGKKNEYLKVVDDLNKDNKDIDGGVARKAIAVVRAEREFLPKLEALNTSERRLFDQQVAQQAQLGNEIRRINEKMDIITNRKSKVPLIGKVINYLKNRIFVSFKNFRELELERNAKVGRYKEQQKQVDSTAKAIIKISEAIAQSKDTRLANLKIIHEKGQGSENAKLIYKQINKEQIDKRLLHDAKLQQQGRTIDYIYEIISNSKNRVADYYKVDRLVKSAVEKRVALTTTNGDLAKILEFQEGSMRLNDTIIGELRACLDEINRNIEEDLSVKEKQLLLVLKRNNLVPEGVADLRNIDPAQIKITSNPEMKLVAAILEGLSDLYRSGQALSNGEYDKDSLMKLHDKKEDNIYIIAKAIKILNKEKNENHGNAIGDIGNGTGLPDEYENSPTISGLATGENALNNEVSMTDSMISCEIYRNLLIPLKIKYLKDKLGVLSEEIKGIWDVVADKAVQNDKDVLSLLEKHNNELTLKIVDHEYKKGQMAKDVPFVNYYQAVIQKAYEGGVPTDPGNFNYKIISDDDFKLFKLLGPGMRNKVDKDELSRHIGYQDNALVMMRTLSLSTNLPGILISLAKQETVLSLLLEDMPRSIKDVFNENLKKIEELRKVPDGGANYLIYKCSLQNLEETRASIIEHLHMVVAKNENVDAEKKILEPTLDLGKEEITNQHIRNLIRNMNRMGVGELKVNQDKTAGLHHLKSAINRSEKVSRNQQAFSDASQRVTKSSRGRVSF